MKRIDAQLRALRRIRRRRRRRTMLTSAAAISAAAVATFSLANFADVDLASAAVERAKSLTELMDRRSPGERVAGVLIKTKHRHYRVLAERGPPEFPLPVLGPALVDVLAPAATMPASELPAAAELIAPKPPGVIFLPPPGGVGCCAPPHQPPPPGPPPPPFGVPEPGTWMTMLLGFAVSGWMLRRRRPPQGEPANG